MPKPMRLAAASSMASATTMMHDGKEYAMLRSSPWA
jgi:hypothetical protein